MRVASSLTVFLLISTRRTHPFTFLNGIGQGVSGSSGSPGKSMMHRGSFVFRRRKKLLSVIDEIVNSLSSKVCDRGTSCTRSMRRNVPVWFWGNVLTTLTWQPLREQACVVGVRICVCLTDDQFFLLCDTVSCGSWGRVCGRHVRDGIAHILGRVGDDAEAVGGMSHESDHSQIGKGVHVRPRCLIHPLSRSVVHDD